MALADAYDALLLDLDGVLYRGDQAVRGAPEILRALRSRSHRLAFVTNNSTRTPERVADKLISLGIEASPGEVVTSALATADLLSSRGGGTAYVVGEEGIRSALAATGIAILDGEPAAVTYVVVGLDRQVTYERLRVASLLVQRGARLVATNADPSFPAAEGWWPGAGALLAVITTTTGAEPEIVGKPHGALYLSALRRTGGERPLVVGDRLDTDIAGALALGWDCLLVLSGVTDHEALERSSIRPTFVADDLRALLEEPA